jgi:hypothetical protein
MANEDDESALADEDVIRGLQEKLAAIEPPADIQEHILRRILDRTARTWREWMNRTGGRLDD